MSASLRRASSLSFSVPTATLILSDDRWSHFSSSEGHPMAATLRGATTRTFPISKLSCISLSMAVRVMLVFPSPQSRRRAHTGWDMMYETAYS